MHDTMIDELEAISSKLSRFLESCGVKPKDRTIHNQLEQLDEVIALRSGRSYIGLQTQPDGVITGFVAVNGIVEEQALPPDLLRGYWRYRDGKIELDEELRQKIWG